ncbi:SH3 domain-containing protein [Oceaniradius stylonematis]|uniref:SH3 domain-containing protein n=1 Tax=Oceaniradius stylonematis TaxID=2184161 RepID=UPI0035D09F44
MVRGSIATLAFAVLAGMAVSKAHASPGFDFVCFDRDIVASVGLDLEWANAYLKIDGEETVLPATGQRSGNSFAFAGNGLSFQGFVPEGQLTLADGRTARCHQTRNSIKTMALYGSDNNFRWSAHDARGTASGNVRAAPSVFAEKVASLGDGEPVIIKRNTDEFLDGFFWFQIEFGEGETGYIWGALLCTDADEPELNTTVRRCS